MIKTTRTRLELRQEPDKTSSAVGALLVAVGSAEAMISLAAIIAEWALPLGRGSLFSWIRFFLSVLFACSAYFFLRGRSRVVLDLDHRMVARYMGVGGAIGGNRSWDLNEFSAVVRRRRDRPGLLKVFTGRCDVVSLRRSDGSGLDLYRAWDDADEVARRVSDFTGLPYQERGRF
jgi:hypothetical protein